MKDLREIGEELVNDFKIRPSIKSCTIHFRSYGLYLTNINKTNLEISDTTSKYFWQDQIQKSLLLEADIKYCLAIDIISLLEKYYRMSETVHPSLEFVYTKEYKAVKQ